MALLAGDVGGTKTILALVENRRVLHQRTFSSRHYGNFGDLVEEFMKDSIHSVSRACFGVAGPVWEGICQATNLPWRIEARELERQLGFHPILLVNDFHALSMGIGELPTSDLVVLHEAPWDPWGTRVILGAGTGLGEAILVKQSTGWQVIASEGGHGDFGPRNELEMNLLRFLLKQFSHVSYERILSGAGLARLYDFFKDQFPEQISPEVEAELEALEDRAPCISAHGLKGDDAICTQALDLFVSIYGAEAGNLALKVLAPGGVYLAGGIAAKILPALQTGRFQSAFLDKGRMRPILERTAVKVIKNPEVGLLGAAALAEQTIVQSIN